MIAAVLAVLLLGLALWLSGTGAPFLWIAVPAGVVACLFAAADRRRRRRRHGLLCDDRERDVYDRDGWLPPPRPESLSPAGPTVMVAGGRPSGRSEFSSVTVVPVLGSRSLVTPGGALAVGGALNLATVARLRSALHRALVDGEVLELNLFGVESCDVLSLGVLVLADRRARRRGGGLFLLAPSQAVLDALRASGLDRLLRVREEEPDVGRPVRAVRSS